MFNLSESVLSKIIIESVDQINRIDTSDFPEGRRHRYLSKAFVAGLGKYFKYCYMYLVFVNNNQNNLMEQHKNIIFINVTNKLIDHITFQIEAIKTNAFFGYESTNADRII